MSNCRICEEKALYVRQVEGYIKNSFYNIHYCEKCNASFSDSHPNDSLIYDLIYENANNINGYKRYEYYNQKVLTSENPLRTLSVMEDMYWGVSEALTLGGIKKTDSILEVGCGLGYLTYSLFSAGYKIKGCDISKVAIAKATYCYDLSNNGLFFQADIYEMKNEEKYDVIILTEVIEHIYDPLSFIRTLLTLLTEKGRLIITTPNKSSFLKDSIWASDLPPVHYWWLSEQSFTKIAHLEKLSARFIDFAVYNRLKKTYIIPSNGGFGVSTFDKDGTLINQTKKKDSVFFMKVKRVIKQTLLFEAFKYLRFLFKKGDDLSKSAVLCCILEK